MLFQSRYMPCPECGGSVDRLESDEHVCDHERQVKYQLFQLRDEVAEFDSELECYLASPRGLFEQWYAARTRPR